jgi:hypothetical protein
VNRSEDETSELHAAISDIELKAKKHRLQIAFVVAAMLFPILLGILAPTLGIEEGGKVSLTRMQLVYAVVSLEIAIAVYLWGVGNWSRFEPPRLPRGVGDAGAPDNLLRPQAPAPVDAPIIDVAPSKPGKPQTPQGGQ